MSDNYNYFHEKYLHPIQNFETQKSENDNLICQVSQNENMINQLCQEKNNGEEQINNNN